MATEVDNPSLKPAIRIFENLFSKLNDQFFDGSLVPPVIVISPEGKASANGWCTSWKAWKSAAGVGKEHSLVNQAGEDAEDEGYYEISLSAEYLGNQTDEIIGTLLHEMVHLYNLQNGIKDTSRSQ